MNPAQKVLVFSFVMFLGACIFGVMNPENDVAFGFAAGVMVAGVFNGIASKIFLPKEAFVSSKKGRL